MATPVGEAVRPPLVVVELELGGELATLGMAFMRSG